MRALLAMAGRASKAEQAAPKSRMQAAVARRASKAESARMAFTVTNQ